MGLLDRDYMKDRRGSAMANEQSLFEQAKNKLMSLKNTLHNKWKGLSPNKKLLTTFGAGLAVGGLGAHLLFGRKKQNQT